MSKLAEHIDFVISTKRLVRDKERLLVAVSGGVDSMALLDILFALSKKHRWKLTVAHFNHQLRGAEADADERAVRSAARKRKLPFVNATADVKAFARAGKLSVEMAARKLRHEFLASTAVRLKIPIIALAHHADDQVEHFFLRLFRGSGSDGLAGMKWSNPSPANPRVRLIRPLLDSTKSDLENYAKEHRLPFREDATNSSIDIQRNRIRHELIPLLTRHYQPGLMRNILRLMELVGAEGELIAQFSRDWLAGGRKPKFDDLPTAVQRRVVQQQLVDRQVVADFELIERLREKAGQYIAVSTNCSVSRDAEGTVKLRSIESVSFNPDKVKVPLGKGKSGLTFGGVKLHWRRADNNGTAHAFHEGNVEFYDADKIGGAIWLRYWQPGDRFQPIGTRSPRKLQDLFTNLKVPRSERVRRIVATTGKGEIFWVEGLRMAEKFKLDETTARRLKWSWRRYGV